MKIEKQNKTYWWVWIVVIFVVLLISLCLFNCLILQPHQIDFVEQGIFIGVCVLLTTIVSIVADLRLKRREINRAHKEYQSIHLKQKKEGEWHDAFKVVAVECIKVFYVCKLVDAQKDIAKSSYLSIERKDNRAQELHKQLAEKNVYLVL